MKYKITWLLHGQGFPNSQSHLAKDAKRSPISLVICSDESKGFMFIYMVPWLLQSSCQVPNGSNMKLPCANIWLCGAMCRQDLKLWFGMILVVCTQGIEATNTSLSSSASSLCDDHLRKDPSDVWIPWDLRSVQPQAPNLCPNLRLQPQISKIVLSLHLS